MSHYSTPLIVVNLGCEMVFVIDQRLKAQHISLDKSERVLTDVVTVLLHPKLLDELFIPQPVATHSIIKQLLLDISTTSIMKLDDFSLNKLWDLMTMIFKWQLSVTTNQNIFDITRRHLKSIAALMPHDFPKIIIEQAMRKFENIAQKFNDDDYKCLINTMILWFSEYHIKISVLLRLGLQKKDGTFSLPSTIKATILQNLGENIYSYDNKKNPVAEYENHCCDSSEINCLLNTIEKISSKPIELKLQTHNKNRYRENIIEINRNTKFENIDTCIKNKTNSDLTFNPNLPKSTNEDLLELMKDT